MARATPNCGEGNYGAQPDTAPGAPHLCGRTGLIADVCRINAAFRSSFRLCAGAVYGCARNYGDTAPKPDEADPEGGTSPARSSLAGRPWTAKLMRFWRPELLRAGTSRAPGAGTHNGGNAGSKTRSGVLLATLLICFWAAGTNLLSAEGGGPRAQAERNFEAREQQFQKHPKDAEPAWQFGRACFDLAEYATNSTERAELAERGTGACRQALAMSSNSAAAHYYLALNLGELARTKSVGALKLVGQMEHELTLATELDAHFDFAGPDRSIGLLYRDAPTIISIGSRSKAKQHLRRAVELAPEYPENRLDLIESYLKWGDRTEARRELSALEAIWPRARAKLSGPDWAASWVDWQNQLEEFKKKVEEASKLESPRH